MIVVPIRSRTRSLITIVIVVVLVATHPAASVLMVVMGSVVSPIILTTIVEKVIMMTIVTLIMEIKVAREVCMRWCEIIHSTHILSIVST